MNIFVVTKTVIITISALYGPLVILLTSLAIATYRVTINLNPGGLIEVKWLD